MSLARLRLYQLVSPALPVGAFSYAEGLEVLVQGGRLGDGPAVRAWLEAELRRGLLAQREAAEMRAQQRQMGQSLLQLLTDLGWPPPAAATPLAWPAAFARAGLCLELEPADVVEAFLHGWVANQLSAAVRLVPLGPTEAQGLQLALAPLVAARAGELAAADPRQLWSGGVGAGLAQLGQAELYSRLFRS